MLHLDLCSFDFPLIRFWTQTKDGRFVSFGHWVLQVGDETGCLLGVVVHKFSECVELVFCCYVQLQTQHQSHIYQVFRSHGADMQ